MLTGTFAQVNVQFSEIFELFLEIDCAEGGLGRIKGNHLIMFFKVKQSSHYIAHIVAQRFFDRCFSLHG